MGSFKNATYSLSMGFLFFLSDFALLSSSWLLFLSLICLDFWLLNWWVIIDDWIGSGKNWCFFGLGHVGYRNLYLGYFISSVVQRIDSGITGILEYFTHFLSMSCLIFLWFWVCSSICRHFICCFVFRLFSIWIRCISIVWHSGTGCWWLYWVLVGRNLNQIISF